MSRQTRTIVLTIIATILVIAMIRNMHAVTVGLVLWDTRVPLSMLMLFVFALGFVGGLFWRRR